MYAATKANVRTATAAQKDGSAAALTVSFYGGSIMGLCVASLGLIGLRGHYIYFYIPAGIDHVHAARRLCYGRVCSSSYFPE